MVSGRYIPEFIILQLFFAVSQLVKEGVTTTPFISVMVSTVVPARIFHELLSRDHEDGCATWQPQGVDSEAYLNGTSQGPTPEDARKDGHIRGRSK
jgi:hypothetical protein